MDRIDPAAEGLWVKRRGERPLTRFQVLGERASGTNIVDRALSWNLDIRPTSALGWKHGFPHMVAIPEDCLVVCTVRDARSWALSMHRRPWHAHPDLQKLAFPDFIRAPWHSIVDRRSHFAAIAPGLKVRGAPLQLDRHPITGEPFANLFALRRAKLAALLGMVNRGCSMALIRLESFQADPETMVNLLAERLGLQRRPAPFRLPGRRLGTAFRRAHPPAAATPASFPAEDLDFLRGSLDLPAELRLGYDYRG